MTHKSMAKAVLGGAALVALLGSAGVASAQVYDHGAAGSGSPGTIIPMNTNSVGATGPVVPASAPISAVPGVPNTGGTSAVNTTPGVPNTGAGDSAVLYVLAVTALIAVSGGVYLVRQRFTLR